MKNQRFSVFLTAVVAIVILSLIALVKAQPYYDAYFTSIKVTYGNGAVELLNGGTSKVYVGQKTWINLTYYNERCGVIWASLYTKVYENDVLIATSSETNVLKGTSIGNQFYLSTYQPNTVSYKVELWWDSSGTHYLEDVRYFNVQFVELFVDNWSPSSLTVEKGKIAPSTLSISFRNGGNDIMYNTSISIVDSGGLQFSTLSANLGDIANKGTKSTSFSVIAPSMLLLGSKSVSFQISYNDFRGTLYQETKTASISVVELGSSITLTLTPSSVKKDSSITITAKLVDGNGNPIANQPIDFWIGTSALGSVSTDSSGTAIKSYTAIVDSGTYTITASYAGSIDYRPANATSNLVINKLDTTLKIDVPSATQGKNCSLKAILKDENDNPLQNMNVDFYIYEGGTWKKTGSATTDASGVAYLNYVPSSTGTFQIKTMFSGTVNYVQTSSTPADLSVIIDYTPYYIGGGIVAVALIGAAGYLVFRRRKKPSIQS